MSLVIMCPSATRDNLKVAASPASPPPTITPAAGFDFDTVIVGSGPSALILSFILHGNIPSYNPDNPHPDPILHKKLLAAPDLLRLDVPELTAHFDASRISYSTQALPVDVLLDTLLRPLSDIEPGEHAPSLRWRYQPERAVKHVVIGDTSRAGGQWASNPVDASWDIQTLSYLEQLSLPRYSLFDHLKASSEPLSLGCERPTRRQVADYLAAYPAAVGIQGSVRVGKVAGISRKAGGGFHVASHGISCRNLVLASGIFTRSIPPPSPLEPLAELETGDDGLTQPLLVVGSGFSAADMIISNIRKRKVIHVFRWMPDERPSPLKACHPQAYPDYAGVYRQMKRASKQHYHDDALSSPTLRGQKQFFDEWAWCENYIGLPNAQVESVKTDSPNIAAVEFKLHNGERVTHHVSSLAHVIGRRGSLDYLEPSLQHEIIGTAGVPSDDEKPARQTDRLITGRTLRAKVDSNVQVAPSVFAIGSLTGDSLIRFAYGGCVEAAGQIFDGASGVARPNGVPEQSFAEKMLPPRVADVQVETADGVVLPVSGGHEDLGRGPASPARSRFRLPRLKSSCVLS